MIEKVYAVFGGELPDKDTFFATTANPMSLLDLRNMYKTWDAFVHEYYMFVKEQNTTPVETKQVTVSVLDKTNEA